MLIQLPPPGGTKLHILVGCQSLSDANTLTLQSQHHASRTPVVSSYPVFTFTCLVVMRNVRKPLTFKHSAEHHSKPIAGLKAQICPADIEHLWCTTVLIGQDCSLLFFLCRISVLF